MAFTVELPEATARIEMTRPMTADEFFEFCAANPDLRVELSPEGVIRVMPPCAVESDDFGAHLLGQLYAWARSDGRGTVNGSSAGFTLPDGSVLSPDVAWTLKVRRASLARAELRRFPRLVPDFVAEVMSPSDRLGEAQEKMRAWMANGVKLGWLLDPAHETVYIYRPGMRAKKVVGGTRLVADAPLDGFVLDLSEVW